MTAQSAADTREFVIAAHGDLPKVQATLAEHPDWLVVNYQWGEDNFETPIQAAAHVGNRPIAEYLLAQGAPLEICTAAMLGRRDTVAELLAADPANAQARGGHGITLLFHTAMSGDTALAQTIYDAGAREGLNQALFGAIAHDRLDMVGWLIDHGATDFTATDFRGRTPLAAAEEDGRAEIAALLQSAIDENPNVRRPTDA
jgi:ankyrin repeat protein